jgi:hypothetical protein
MACEAQSKSGSRALQKFAPCHSPLTFSHDLFPLVVYFFNDGETPN